MSFLQISLPGLSAVREPLALICYPSEPFSLVSLDFPHAQHLQQRRLVMTAVCCLNESERCGSPNHAEHQRCNI